MKPSARIAASIEVLQDINSAWEIHRHTPADILLGKYFKQRRFMGSKDRFFVGELVYFVLRHGGALQWWLERSKAEVKPRHLVLLALVLGYKHSLEEVNHLFTGEKYAPETLSETETTLVSNHIGLNIEKDFMPEWARYNIAEWMEAPLRASLGDDFSAEMREAMKEAPVDLRVNTLKTSRADVIFALDKEDILCSPTRFAPNGLRLKKRAPIMATKAFKDGWFEVQDEGSQICAALVAAQPGEKVIDFCAGAGGKSLAIAAAMENKGRILAWDTSDKRLNKLPKRLARAGVSTVQLRVIGSEQDAAIKRHAASADWVLVDAPCSGSGTWRRNPDLKWRFTQEDLAEVIKTQAAILSSARQLVKPGGALIYVTCSLLREENEAQLLRFLGENSDFRVESPDKMWDNHLSHEPDVGSVLRLTPHKDGTDGFFAAILRREQ